MGSLHVSTGTEFVHHPPSSSYLQGTLRPEGELSPSMGGGAAPRKVAFITGTAGTAQVSFASIGPTSYKNAAGDTVSFSAVQRVAFSWGGTSERTLAEISDSVFILRSKSGSVAVSDCTASTVQPQVSSGVGTGTYTIILYGT